MRILFDIAHFSFIQILVIGGFFFGVFYFTAYDNGKNLQAEIKTAQTEIQTASEQLEQKQKELQDIKSFETEVLNQEEVIRQFLNFVPSSLTFTDMFSLLTKEAKASGVNIVDKRDERITEIEDSEYQTLNIKLTVEGAFTQVLVFLSKMTQQRRMLIVNNIDMNITNAENQMIKTNMLISAYRYEEKKSKEKQKEK